MSLLETKTASNASKTAVHGFIRRHERKHSISTSVMIKHLVFKFYFLNEAFHPNKAIKTGCAKGALVKCSQGRYRSSKSLQTKQKKSKKNKSRKGRSKSTTKKAVNKKNGCNSPAKRMRKCVFIPETPLKPNVMGLKRQLMRSVTAKDEIKDVLNELDCDDDPYDFKGRIDELAKQQINRTNEMKLRQTGGDDDDEKTVCFETPKELEGSLDEEDIGHKAKSERHCNAVVHDAFDETTHSRT